MKDPGNYNYSTKRMIKFSQSLNASPQYVNSCSLFRHISKRLKPVCVVKNLKSVPKGTLLETVEDNKK